MAPFNLGRSVSTHSPYHGRLPSFSSLNGIELQVQRKFCAASIIYYEGNIAYIMIGANGIVRGKKVTSLARWPPNPSRCWALTWRTIGPMEDYWARSGGLLAEWPLPPRAECFHSLA